MLALSKKMYYATEAVLYIAFNAKSAPVSGSEIADAQLLPNRYLEPMMQRLVRAGILRGQRGPQGGYTLGRERRRITLADIHSALGEKLDLPPTATPLGKKVLSDVTKTLVADWRKQLESITIEHLCNAAHRNNVSSNRDAHPTFAI